MTFLPMEMGVGKNLGVYGRVNICIWAVRSESKKVSGGSDWR